MQAGIIEVTGHRPEKLYGYDLTEPRWVKLKELFKKVLLKEKATAGVTFITDICANAKGYATLAEKKLRK